MSVRKIRNTWWVDFRFERNRYRKKSPTNSREGAKDYEATLRQKLSRGEKLEEEKTESKESFAKFARTWFEVYVKGNNKHSEIISKESILRVHLIPFFGKIILERIDTQIIERYKREKTKTNLCNKSINNHLAVMRKCLETALEWKILKETPKIKFLKTPPQKFDYLSESECQTLLANTSKDLHDMILIGLNAGLRFGEIIALSWKDVDLDRKILSISQSIAKGKIGSTKSNRNRFIPMSEQLCEMLKRRIRENNLVFCENGEPLNQIKYCKLLYKACRGSNLREIGWHVLRHTFASHLAQKNISIKAIQELLGHSDIKTTMRYAHLSPSELRSAVDVLNFGQHVVNTPDFTLKIGLSDKLLYPVNSAKTKQKQPLSESFL